MLGFRLCLVRPVRVRKLVRLEPSDARVQVRAHRRGGHDPPGRKIGVTLVHRFEPSGRHRAGRIVVVHAAMIAHRAGLQKPDLPKGGTSLVGIRPTMLLRAIGRFPRAATAPPPEQGSGAPLAALRPGCAG